MTPRLASLRYRYDDPALYGLEEVERGAAAWRHAQALAQNVRVSETVLPRVHRAVRAAATALGEEREVAAFVHAHAEATASCFLDDESRHTLIFVSSGMVQRLDPAEMAYVVGHELGHMLFGHGRYPVARGPEDLRILELARASEITADRAGFVACGDRDAALSGMLKVASGLDGPALDIDLAAYVRQVQELRSAQGDESMLYSTHPPFPIRARALLRLDAARRRDGGEDPGEEGVRRVDEQIRREMDEASQGAFGNRFTELARAAAFWEVALEASRDGRLDATEQARIEERFGESRLASLRELLRGRGREEAVALLEQRASEAAARVAAAPLFATSVLEAERARSRDG